MNFKNLILTVKDKFSSKKIMNIKESKKLFNQMVEGNFHLK